VKAFIGILREKELDFDLLLAML